MDKQQRIWVLLGEFLQQRHGDGAVKMDLHDTTLSIRARAAYCPDHGEVIAEDHGGQYLCWCGESVMLKAELQKNLEAMAIASMSTDPTWRM